MNLGSGIKVDASGHVAASAPWVAKRPHDRPIRKYAPNRRCTCGARLSIYNDTDVCAPCSGERWADH